MDTTRIFKETSDLGHFSDGHNDESVDQNVQKTHSNSNEKGVEILVQSQVDVSALPGRDILVVKPDSDKNVSKERNDQGEKVTQNRSMTLIENENGESRSGGVEICNVISEHLGETMNTFMDENSTSEEPLHLKIHPVSESEFFDVTINKQKLNEENQVQQRNLSSRSNHSLSNGPKHVEDEAVANEYNEIECSPVILSVRGNATDVEYVTEASMISDNSKSLTQIPMPKEANVIKDTSPVISTMNALPVNKDKTISINNKDLSSQVTLTPILSMPASTFLQSIMSNAEVSDPTNQPARSNIALVQLSTCGNSNVDKLKTQPTSIIPASSKRAPSNIISSSSGPVSLLNVGNTSISSSSSSASISPMTSGASCSSTLSNHQTHAIVRTTANANASAVKIVFKGSQLMGSQNMIMPKRIPIRDSSVISKNNDNVNINNNNSNKSSCLSNLLDSTCYYKSVVDKIFSCAARQEGMNRLDVFNTNLLNPTKRKVQESSDKKFWCSVCGEEFYLEEFFKHHLERKVFILTYHCRMCKKKLIFYNKCKFWQHVGRERPEGINTDKFKHETSYFSLKPYAELDKTVQILSCKFCVEGFSNNHEMEQHYKRVDSTNVYPCHECSLTLLNKCALFAHSTIHKAKTMDVVCPECGKILVHSDGLKPLFDHLDSCNHFNLGYTVSCRCGESFTSLTAVSRHLLDSHTKLLVRCHCCHSCFASPHQLSLHCKLKHGIIAAPSKVVLCTLCNQGVQNICKLKSHIEDHCSKMKAVMKPVLLCFLCKKSFGCPKALNEHVDREHAHRPKRCTICFGLFESRQHLVQHIVSKSCTAGELPKKLHLCLDMPPGENEHTDLSDDYKKKFIIPHKKASQPSVLLTPVSSVNDLQSSKRTSSSSPSVSSSSTSSMSSFTSAPVNMAKIPDKPKSVEKVVEHCTDRRKFQCHSCKICVVGSHHFAKHMELHKLSGFMRSQTHCGICKKTVDDSLIRSHMEDHQKRGIIVCSLCHSRNFGTMHDALEHPKNMCFYKEVEDDGALYVKGKESLTSSENIESCDMTEEGSENENDVEMRSSYEEVGQEASSVFPCLMCGLAFSSKEEKEDHVTRVHDGTRTVYFCLFCKRKGIRKCFSKKNMISKHIGHKHRVVNPIAIANLIHEEEQNMTSGCVVPAEFNDQSSGDATPPKRLRLATKGDFICGKCGFSSGDSKLFEDHIATHNPKNEPQCPECGLCFTVLAALKKHLFVVHKIKAMDEYLEKKGMLPAEEEEQDDDDDSIDLLGSFGSVLTYNQQKLDTRFAREKIAKSACNNNNNNLFECNVCYRTFSSEADLKSHMRNHGMAFIRSRRHDKTSA